MRDEKNKSIDYAKSSVTITLQNIGKRFNREWIFRNINYQFSAHEKYAILGTNGSGKSTLMQIIAGAISESEGKIIYTGDSAHQMQSPFRELGFAAPYLELPEEMTWRECAVFQGKFKRFIPGLTRNDIISISGLKASADKEIRNFSSGMKQRAKLSLAILSSSPLLLLDEPATNLDSNAVKWYQNLIAEFAKDKLVVVCSNYNNEEYGFCRQSLVMPAR